MRQTHGVKTFRYIPALNVSHHTESFLHEAYGVYGGLIYYETSKNYSSVNVGVIRGGWCHGRDW